jgi:hypothetical protein
MTFCEIYRPLWVQQRTGIQSHPSLRTPARLRLPLGGPEKRFIPHCLRHQVRFHGRHLERSPTWHSACHPLVPAAGHPGLLRRTGIASAGGYILGRPQRLLRRFDPSPGRFVGDGSGYGAVAPGPRPTPGAVSSQSRRTRSGGAANRKRQSNSLLFALPEHGGIHGGCRSQNVSDRKKSWPGRTPSPPRSEHFARAEVEGGGDFLEAASQGRSGCWASLRRAFTKRRFLECPVVAVGDHPLRLQPKHSARTGIGRRFGSAGGPIHWRSGRNSWTALASDLCERNHGSSNSIIMKKSRNQQINALCVAAPRRVSGRTPNCDHVNCHPAQYRINFFEKRGFRFCPKLTQQLKAVSTMKREFIQRSGMFFRRR